MKYVISFLKGGFNWQNGPQILERLWKPLLLVTEHQHLCQPLTLKKMSDSLKAQGTSWNRKDDVLTFTNASSILTEKDPKTKRSFISLYSRVFEPISLLIPFLVTSRIVGSRSRLGSATGLRYQDLLGDLEKRPRKHWPNQSSKVFTWKSVFSWQNWAPWIRWCQRKTLWVSCLHLC